MPKVVNVHVSTVDAELEFTIQSSTTGKQFFERITKAIGLRETWYFGLLYTDTSGLTCWLDLGKKILSQDIKKESPLKFRFVAKYFPEDAEEELILYHTKNLFYLQVKNSILTDEYYCPAETAVLLGSYSVQAKLGDYDEETHEPGYLKNEPLLPPRVIKQHSLTKAEWDERVAAWHKEHRGTFRETAITEYLKIAQDLEMYGINYFEITNKKGTKLWLGADALGVNIYDQEDKLTPKIGFPWSEVKNVSYKGKKFVVKTVDKNSPDFIFLTGKSKINKEILGLCTGNYELYTRRRKPDTVEVQQMKNQVKEEKHTKESERQMLLKEKKQREEALKQKSELEEKILVYIREVESSKDDLERTQKTAVDLERKLFELELSRNELEESQRRAEEARRLAEAAVYAEKSERELKEREAAEAQALLEGHMEEARMHEEEARRLKEELQQARLLIAKVQLDSSSGSSSPSKRTDESAVVIVQKPQDYHPGYEIDYENMRYVTSTTTNNNTMIHENDFRRFEINPEVATSDSNDQESRELQVDYELIIKNEEERLTEVDKNEKTSRQLKVLRNDLERSKVEKELTRNDLIYVKNVKEGRDKYKTLKQIRQGNTKIRIEIFESL